MNWINILNNREHIFVFDEKKPNIELINSILNEMHLHMPVKQNKILFNVLVIDNTTDDIKKIKIYESTQTDYNDKFISRYNPQVLAPYLFLFFIKKETEHLRDEALLQIGMASMFVNFSAINQKVDIGFCRCIKETEIIKNNYNEVQLIIGLGYKSDKNEYFCPVDKKNKPIPKKVSIKCEPSEYIFYEKD
jgi:hypothetical protein